MLHIKNLEQNKNSHLESNLWKVQENSPQNQSNDYRDSLMTNEVYTPKCEFQQINMDQWLLSYKKKYEQQSPTTPQKEKLEINQEELNQIQNLQQCEIRDSNDQQLHNKEAHQIQIDIENLNQSSENAQQQNQQQQQDQQQQQQQQNNQVQQIQQPQSQSIQNEYQSVILNENKQMYDDKVNDEIEKLINFSICKIYKIMLILINFGYKVCLYSTIQDYFSELKNSQLFKNIPVIDSDNQFQLSLVYGSISFSILQVITYLLCDASCFKSLKEQQQIDRLSIAGLQCSIFFEIIQFVFIQIYLWEESSIAKIVGVLIFCQYFVQQGYNVTKYKKMLTLMLYYKYQPQQQV